jgi:hypothetical protein
MPVMSVSHKALQPIDIIESPIQPNQCPGIEVMEKITREQYSCLKRINWDYNISIEDMFAVINGEKSHAGHWNLEDLLIRMLERLSWYDVLDFFGPDVMAKKLTFDLLHRIHNREKSHP